MSSKHQLDHKAEKKAAPKRSKVFHHRPYIIGVSGGTASGKTTVCQHIMRTFSLKKLQNHFGKEKVALLSLDRYYKGLKPEQLESVGNYNFDHPDAFDWDALFQTLKDMKSGKEVEVPVYDFATHSRLPNKETIPPADIYLFEGILALHDPRVRDELDIKVFVDADSDLRLARRLTRDVEARGRDVKGVLHQYQKTVKPSFDEFILPTKSFADIIIPNNGYNPVAIDILVNYVHTKLHMAAVCQGRPVEALALAHIVDEDELAYVK